MMQRRGFAALAIGFASGLWAAGADFWNKRDAADWTEEEIDRLLTKSPWAKQAATILLPGEKGAPSEEQGEAGVGVNGIGIGRGGRQERQEGKVTGSPVPYQGVVVWESAQAILDARKKPLPKEFKDHYALSISGIPLRQLGEEQLYDQLRQFTTLQPNDQAPIQPGTVQKIKGDGRVLVGFAKDVLELSANDKSIQFVTQVSRVLVKCKFDTKEMRYKGKLAI